MTVQCGNCGSGLKPGIGSDCCVAKTFRDRLDQDMKTIRDLSSQVQGLKAQMLRERDDLKARAEKAEAGEKAAQDDRRAWEAEATEAKRRAENAERTRDELAEALKWERVAFEDRRVRLEAAERERDERWRVVENQRADLQTLTARRDDLTVALVAAQARERELRVALALYPTPEGRPEVWAKGASTYLFTKAVAEFEDARAAALSAPQDTTALREFGLGIAHTVYNREEVFANDLPAIVDARLKGDGHPLADAFEANEGPAGEQSEDDPPKETP